MCARCESCSNCSASAPSAAASGARPSSKRAVRDEAERGARQVGLMAAARQGAGVLCQAVRQAPRVARAGEQRRQNRARDADLPEVGTAQRARGELRHEVQPARHVVRRHQAGTVEQALEHDCVFGARRFGRVQWAARAAHPQPEQAQRSRVRARRTGSSATPRRPARTAVASAAGPRRCDRCREMQRRTLQQRRAPRRLGRAPLALRRTRGRLRSSGRRARALRPVARAGSGARSRLRARGRSRGRETRRCARTPSCCRRSRPPRRRRLQRARPRPRRASARTGSPDRRLRVRSTPAPGAGGARAATSGVSRSVNASRMRS